MNPPRSAVPAEVEVYHGHLLAAFDAMTDQASVPPEVALKALARLWQAFDFYLEAEPLKLALHLLAPWPLLQQALRHFAGMIYPEKIQGGPRPLSKPDSELLPPELLPWLDFLFPGRAPRLSVCMIVRNEAHCLGRALESVQGLADEIVVVDTGSIDGTQAIASRYPHLILDEIEWPDDFAVARNHSLQLATGDWIMILDADEVLLPESRDFLKHCCAYPPLGWQIFTCQINHLLPGGMFYTWTTRIFRRDAELRFSGALHEMPRKRKWPAWLLQTAIPGIIEHSGNLPETYARQQKSKRTDKLRRLVEDPASYTPFLAYHYAHLLVNGIDVEPDPVLAEKLLLASLGEAEAYEGKLPPHPDWIAVSVPAIALLLAQLWSQQGKHAEVAGLYGRFAATCRVTAFPALGAASLMALGRYDEARVAWLRCFDPGLIPIQQHETWQQQALEGLLQFGLLVHDGLLALWAVRRLRENFPDGRVPGKDYDLIQVQRQLEALLSLPPGTWLDRLEFEIRRALGQGDIAAVCFFALAYLCEAWDQTVLGDAVRALHHLNAPALAHAVAGLGRTLFPENPLFQAFAHQGPIAPGGLDLEQCAVPGGPYWLHLTRPPQRRPRVSLCMIVRNAADTLPACLASLEPVVDEYVIADTGSEDETVSIIQEWAKTHKVVTWHQPWTDDFAAARNALFERTTGDWVLIVDADETLTPESVPRLRELFAYAPAGLQLMAIRCASLQTDPSQNIEDWVPRMYRNTPLIRYWGAIHNIPGHAADAERLPITAFSGVRLVHSGYLPRMVHKHKKSARLEKLRKQLSVQDLPNPYYLYHMGYALMYQYDPPRYDEALELLEQALAESRRFRHRPPVPGWFPAPVRLAQLMIFRLLAHAQRDDEILERYAVHIANGEHIHEPEYHYWYARAALRRGDAAAARQGFERCLQSKEPGQPQAGFGSWKAWLGLSEVALAQADWSLGVEAFQFLIALEAEGLMRIDAQRLMSEWWIKMGAARPPMADG